MSALLHHLITRIKRMGPMTVADYLTECLLHPEHGYYTTRDPLGRQGDFTTAPEVSQMFGELIGLWMAQVWIDQGAPDGCILAELGPGRGTLMSDILRATARVPGFREAMELHLVEASPSLRAQQAGLLVEAMPQFHDHPGSLPDGPLFLVANEFFDALPIRQFQRGPKGWHERHIGVEDNTLIWGLGPETNFEALAHRLEGTTEGQIVELNAPAAPIAADLGTRIAEQGGVALIIDYGDGESIGDTFQAVQSHRSVDPLATPGEADLTAHVAFGPIARAAQPAIASPLIPQGVFLERLGITGRAQQLADSLNGADLEALISDHRRLTHPEEMGTLFKCLALTPPDAAPPPCFDPVPTDAK